MVKLSDYVADFLVQKGVKHTFGITGGAIIHIFDSIAKNPHIENICTQHEQAAAMAADAYSRVSGNIGVAIATSGPGATNLITGVGCSYFDSIPVLMITGQVPISQLKGDSKSRQIGFQETDVVSLFKSITKYCVLVENPQKIKYELEKAFYLAKNGRPGPVLLDIPDDVQRAEVNPEELEKFDPIKENLEPKKDILILKEKINDVVRLIEQSERPIIILGNGIKLAGEEAKSQTKKLIEKLQIPIALTWAMLDFLPHNYPLSVRDFGVTANRPGNFAVQNADLIIAIGTRLDTHETGSNLKTFSREAKRVVVDIDESELEKYEKRGLKIDVPIHAHVRDFLNELNEKVYEIKKKDISLWKEKIRSWKERYPTCLPEYFKGEQINPYVFLDIISDEASERDIIIPEAGCNVTWSFQGWKIKSGQNLFTAYNHSPMGYGLPAAIGACFANNKNPVMCIVGDGGIQMNIQEFATVARHKLPIKIILFNNKGYGMIQQTQETWLDNRYVGSCPDSGLPDIDFNKIAQAYNIKTMVIENHKEIKEKVREVLDFNGPILCDVRIHPKARIYPKLTFGRPIEDSAPILSDEEFEKEMIVKSLRVKDNSGDKKKHNISSQIDSHKLSYHPERVAEWDEKEDCYPIYVEIGPNVACNHKCIFCALDFMNHSGYFIDTEVMLKTLKEMAEKAVKSVMFAGEGEPLLHKDIGLFARTAKESGMDVSITTNGVLFTKEKREQCLPYLSWIRFSVDSGSPENYALVHGTNSSDFEKVIENIKESVKFVKENNLNTTIGVQFLVIPQNKGEAVKLAKILRDIGADNLQIKPYSRHPDSLNNLILNIDEYNKIEEELKGLDDDKFKIIFRKASAERIEEGNMYPQCYGLPFFALIDANGNIIPCNLFYGKEDFFYGNLYRNSFPEIWESEQRKRIIMKLKEIGVDNCRKGCRLDPINRYLHRLKNPEAHDNFI